MSERMEIDALRALKAVADTGGVTRAARQLALSQSAVSHKIRRLEESIECLLLSRRAGAPLLTESGARLLSYAERILKLHDEAVLALSKRSLAGRLRLGLTEDVASGRLAQILARFAQLYPQVRVRTQVAQSLALAAQLDERAIDLAVMQIFVADVRRTDLVLREEPLHWVAGLDFRAPGTGATPFLAFDEACFYRRWAMEQPAPSGQRFETVFACASAAGIASAVEAGMGIALLNARALSPRMRILDAEFGAPPRIAYIVRTAPDAPSAAIGALASEIEAEMQAPAALAAAL